MSESQGKARRKRKGRPPLPVGRGWLALRLAGMMREIGMNRAELARAAGVSGTTVKRILSQAADPKLSVVVALAVALGVSLDAFDPRIVFTDGRPLDGGPGGAE